MGHKRQYSDEERALALAALDANKGNLYRTSKQRNIPYNTLRDWSQGRGTVPAVAEIREQKRGDLATELENVVFEILKVIPTKLQDSNITSLMTAFGIAVDKLQLLRNKPTSIIDGMIGHGNFSFESLTDEQLEHIIALSLRFGESGGGGDTGSGEAGASETE